MISTFRVCLALFLAALASTANAEESTIRAYPLPDHGSIQLSVPASWRDQISQPPDRLPPTVRFRPDGGAMFEVLITPIYPPAGTRMPPANSQKLRAGVEAVAKEAASSAVEKKITIQELRNGSGIGYYFSATDKALAEAEKAVDPDDYKYMTQGVFRVDELSVSFTVLTNDTSAGTVSKALDMIKSARQKQAEAGADQADRLKIKEANGNYELTAPVSELMMTIPGRGLLPAPDNAAARVNGPRYFMFEDKQSGLVVSGWFEPAQAFPGIRKFWENETGAWQQKGLPAPRNVVFEKIGQWDAITYDIRLPVGGNSHIRAHWLQAGTWIDVHLSYTSQRANAAESKAKLLAMLRGIQVQKKK